MTVTILKGAPATRQAKPPSPLRSGGLRLVFFASGHGSALRAVQRAYRAGVLNARPVLLLASVKAEGALAFAHAEKIPVRVINPEDEAEICALLADSSPDLIILGGYLRKIGGKILAAYAPNIINVHPSLLPAYGGKGMYGRRVHEAVLAAGECQSGASVHIVNAEYDRGPVIAQAQVVVHKGDTPAQLEARVMACEADLLVKTLGQIEAGVLDLHQCAAQDKSLLKLGSRKRVA